MKTKIKLTGNKKDGYILSMQNKNEEYMWDCAITEVELEALYKLLVRKFK